MIQQYERCIRIERWHYRTAEYDWSQKSHSTYLEFTANTKQHRTDDNHNTTPIRHHVTKVPLISGISCYNFTKVPLISGSFENREKGTEGAGEKTERWAQLKLMLVDSTRAKTTRFVVIDLNLQAIEMRWFWWLVCLSGFNVRQRYKAIQTISHSSRSTTNNWVGLRFTAPSLPQRSTHPSTNQSRRALTSIDKPLS